MILPFVLTLALIAAPQEPIVQRFGGGSSGSPRVVLVDRAALVHTTQLIANGETQSLDQQAVDVFAQLKSLLKTYESGASDVVKLNLYIADEKARAVVEDQMQKWGDDARPAVCFVKTRLPRGRSVALDAVFVSRRSSPAKGVAYELTGDGGSPASPPWAIASTMPPGDAVYISGQAKAAPDGAKESSNLGKATTATLEGLQATLRAMQLRRADVVQVKCFLQPMKDVAQVEAAIGSFFTGQSVPPVSYVEWIAGGKRPIEIEIVAAAPPAATRETVSYFTPPGLKASPVFSRVARIHGNRRVYTDGITAQAAGDAEAQVHSIFQQLIRALKPTRANLRHLAKATYYVADTEVSSQLGKIRPHYYDGARPPAASKATVHGVASSKERRISIDIIAAPESPLNSVLATRAVKLQPTRSLVYQEIDNRQLRLHVFEPQGHRQSDRRPVFLAIHGGGWTGGNARQFFPFADHFAQHGMLGVSLEYRLKNERTTVFDCVRDARSAVRWIRSHADQLGADPDRIVAMGGSAGGHLALSTAMFPRVDGQKQAAAKADLARPNALILMYPVIDTSSEGYGQKKIGDQWRKLSPVHNVQAKLPPMLLLHGTGDAVTPYSGAERFHRLATAAGNRCQLITKPAGRHGYIIFAEHEFTLALSQMREFVSEQGVQLESPKPAASKKK